MFTPSPRAPRHSRQRLVGFRAELSREELIDLADTIGDDDIHVKDRATLHRRSIHGKIDMHLVGREITFLKGGFPVNFDDEINCVPIAREAARSTAGGSPGAKNTDTP